MIFLTDTADLTPEFVALIYVHGEQPYKCYLPVKVQSSRCYLLLPLSLLQPSDQLATYPEIVYPHPLIINLCYTVFPLWKMPAVNHNIPQSVVDGRHAVF